jgi:hypothetical protein
MRLVFIDFKWARCGEHICKTALLMEGGVDVALRRSLRLHAKALSSSSSNVFNRNDFALLFDIYTNASFVASYSYG